MSDRTRTDQATRYVQAEVLTITKKKQTIVDTGVRKRPGVWSVFATNASHQRKAKDPRPRRIRREARRVHARAGK